MFFENFYSVYYCLGVIIVSFVCVFIAKHVDCKKLRNNDKKSDDTRRNSKQLESEIESRSVSTAINIDSIMFSTLKFEDDEQYSELYSPQTPVFKPKLEFTTTFVKN